MSIKVELQTLRAGLVISLQVVREPIRITKGTDEGFFVSLFFTPDAGKLLTPDANEFMVSA